MAATPAATVAVKKARNTPKVVGTLLLLLAAPVACIAGAAANKGGPVFFAIGGSLAVLGFILFIVGRFQD